MTSYQKLKKENAELRNRLRILIDEPDSLAANLIRTERQLEKSFEKIVWFSDSKVWDGLISQITDSNDNPIYPSL